MQNSVNPQERPIIKAIRKEYEKAKQRGWDSWFYVVDIHETVLKPNYTTIGDIPRTMYKDAPECLQKMSNRKDLKLILGTSSKKEDIDKYQEFFKANGINFPYVNENPEYKSAGHADFTQKFYFSVMLEDKAGFDPEIDWKVISEFLDTLPELVGVEKVFDVTATVARMHSPFGPHEGHDALITKMFSQGKNVLFFLACDPSYPSKKNTFTFEDRRVRLQEAIKRLGFGERKYSIIALENKEYNDDWSMALDGAIALHTQNPSVQDTNVALFHSRDGFGRHYTPYGKFPVLFVQEIPNVSATDIRDRVNSMNLNSIDFLIGKSVQQNAMPRLTLNQVRVILVDEAGRYLLITYKGSRGCGRFVGGYFSPDKDKSLLDCLKRKLTGKLIGADNIQPKLIAAVPVTDWKHRENGASDSMYGLYC
jgi:nicotinamide mononucleotide adenylyltransferase